MKHYLTRPLRLISTKSESLFLSFSLFSFFFQKKKKKKKRRGGGGGGRYPPAQSVSLFFSPTKLSVATAETKTVLANRASRKGGKSLQTARKGTVHRRGKGDNPRSYTSQR